MVATTPISLIKTRWRVVLGTAGILLGIFITYLILQSLTPPTYHGILLQSPEPAPNFSLVGKDEQTVSLSDFQGKIVLLYFGYTHCPDACPATLTILKQVQTQLGKQADQVQIILITTDPERDSPDVIQEYVTRFHPAFMGLSGTADALREVAASYGIFAEKSADSHEHSADYQIDHTTTLNLIDQQGYLRLIYPFNTAAADIAADVAQLIANP